MRRIEVMVMHYAEVHTEDTNAVVKWASQIDALLNTEIKASLSQNFMRLNSYPLTFEPHSKISSATDGDLHGVLLVMMDTKRADGCIELLR